MKKVIGDMVKTPGGKHSLKRVTTVVILILTILLGTFIVISDKILNTVINTYFL